VIAAPSGRNGLELCGTIVPSARSLADIDDAEDKPMLSTILIVILILLLVAALPAWPYSSGWGYYPGGGLGLILIIVIILAVSGRL
jgi:hypothetical protein